MAAPEKGMSVINFIQHYQRSILKSQEDEIRLLHCLEKLHGLQVQVSHLQATGVGRTVNALRKRPGAVGEAARKLVARWKQIVEAHVSSEDEGGSELPSSTQSGYETTHPQCDTPESHPTTSPPNHHPTISPQNQSQERQNSLETSTRNKTTNEEEMDKSHHRNRSPSNKKHTNKHSSSSKRLESPRKHDSNHKNMRQRSPSSKRHHSHESRRDKKEKSDRESRSNSHDKKEKSDRESRSNSHDKKEKSRHRREEGNGRSSRERSHHSESPNKDSKHSDRHKSRDKSSSNHKIKDKKPKLDLKRVKKEPDESKTKKIKVEEPPPLMFDFVKPQVKLEPSYEVEEPLDLPVPRFKREESPVTKGKVKLEQNGGDSPIGASFEEALGFIDVSPSKSKSKRDKKRKNVPSSSSTSSSDYSTPLPRSEELAAILDLPSINPNYRPLPQIPVRTQRAPLSDHDALTAVISNKGQRTKVYSGVKNLQGEVTSLQDMCIKILQDNIDALEYIGWAPFYLMEPVLARASAQQLANIERHNPRLSEDTDDLWHTLVKCEFRGADRQDGECWRDVYERSLEEREDKLGSLKAKIKRNNEARKAPQRTTKLAYVNSHVKPPRSVLRQQAKHGTARGSLPAPRPKPVPGEEQPGPSGQSSHASTLARTVGMLRDGPSMSIKSKKRPAPLMQKTLKFMKTSYRR